MLLALMSGEHTLDEVTLKTYTKLLDIAESQNWSDKRLWARALSVGISRSCSSLVYFCTIREAYRVSSSQFATDQRAS